MSGITYDFTEKFIKGLINEHDGILKDMEEYAKENRVPIVCKETARFLEVFINIKKPLKILELGTAIGYSAILMIMNSSKDTKLETIERDPKMIEIAKQNINQYGYNDRIKILEGDCLKILPELEGKYDMIFIDSGKGHYNHFLPYCLKLLNNDGVIIADNVLYKGMLASKELFVRRKVTIVKRMKSFLNEVNNNPELITSVLPMGDGIAVITRKLKN